MKPIKIDLSSLEKGPRQAVNLNTGVFAKDYVYDNISHGKCNEFHKASMSYFASVSDTEPCGKLTLLELIERIQGDADKELVETIRQAPDKEERDRLKKQLPCVSVSGIVATGGRANANAEGRFVPNGLLACDFDTKDFAGKNADQVRSLLLADTCVQAVFKTPSGGMKAIIRIPVCATPEAHTQAFLAAEALFAKSGLTMDKATKDPVRLTYLSHDPDAWLRPTAAKELPVSQQETSVFECKKPLPEKSRPQREQSHKEGRTWTPQETREMLAHIPPKPPYDDWIKIIAAVRSEVDEAEAISILKEWSPEDKPGEYLEKIRSGLDQIGIGTLIHIAKKNGWKRPIQSKDNQVRVVISPLGVEQAGFQTIRASEIGKALETLDFVQGLLVDEAMSVVYGPSNCGKSFWSLHLAACVAMGQPFFGREVEKGAVLYFGLEGRAGTHNRIAAMKRMGLLTDDPPLHLCFSPLSLLDQGHADLVAKTIDEIQHREGCKLKLIVIDTYARAMAGGDENSGKDTSEVVATVDAIKAASKAHVMLIHHCGKDEARGARGHSSLRAATDTEIEITRPDANSPSIISVKKQRDLAIAGIMGFSLERVYLGKDRRGNAITSCVVKHEIDCELPARKKGRLPKASDKDLLNLLPQPNTTTWQTAAKEALGISKSVFYEMLKRIKEAGSAVSEADGSWASKILFQNQFPDLQSSTNQAFPGFGPE